MAQDGGDETARAARELFSGRAGDVHGVSPVPGFAAAQECGAAEAFAAARTVKPDVIVTDLALPGHGDGIDLIGQLRAHPETAHTCIVVVSGFVMGEFQQALKPQERTCS